MVLEIYEEKCKIWRSLTETRNEKNPKREEKNHHQIVDKRISNML